MNVQAYYNNNLKVFEGITTTLLDTSELTMLDIIFLQKYKYNVMDADEQSTVKILASNVLFKNHNYYEAIKKSYETEFDALTTTDIDERQEDQTSTTKALTEESSHTASNTRNLNTDHTTTGTVTDIKTTKTLGKDPDNENKVTVTNTKKGSVMEKFKTDGSYKEGGEDKVTTKNIHVHTPENPDTKATSSIQRPIYDDSTPMSTEVSAVTTEDNKVMEVTTKPGAIKKEDNTKVTTFGKKVDSGGDILLDEYKESVDTINRVNLENKSEVEYKNYKVADGGSITDTGGGSLNKTISDKGTLTQLLDKSMKGRLNANFLKLINDIHESRKINLYDIILSDVFDVICLTMYDFDTM